MAGMYAQEDDVDAVSAATEEIPAVAEETDAVSGATEEIPATDGESGKKALPVLSFKFFGDFDIDASAAGDFSGDPTFTFTQNHQALLIRAVGNPDLSILADIFHPDDLFQMGISFKDLQLTFGRIFIPFGDFNYHHFYGGRQDDNGIFFPKLWTDYGFSLGFPVGNILGIEVYTVNGFDPAGIVLENARFASVGKVDNDLAKAIGARFTLTPIKNVKLMVSGYQDFYADDVKHTVTLAGGDGEFKYGPFALRGGVAFGLVRGPDIAEFFRWANYGEVTYNAWRNLSLRLRGGAMDPDVRISNPDDQNNVNFSVIWRTAWVEYALTYFRNFSGGSFADDPIVSDKHQLLLKILVVL